MFILLCTYSPTCLVSYRNISDCFLLTLFSMTITLFCELIHCKNQRDRSEGETAPNYFKKQHFTVTVFLRSTRLNFEILTKMWVKQLLQWCGDQNNHQNFDPSLLPKNLKLIFMEMKQKKNLF